MTNASQAGAVTDAVDVESPYALEPDAIRRFNEQGFVRLPNVLSPATIRHFEPEITAKVIELNTLHLPMEERSTYQKAFLQVTNLWQHSEVVRQLVFSKRLARIAAELMGVDGARLYHDQALYKETGGGITPWHADEYYWPFSSDRCCTAWIPLQQTPLEMGPLGFATGSHRFEFGRDLQISDESEERLQEATAEQGFEVSIEPYALGDVSFHLGWTFHRANPNHTEVPRRAMTVIYLDADMVVAEPKNENQAGDLASWMPGARPGEVPETPLNPVLYRSSGLG
jgi:ectoine hydroxylase-related dioxygenase (phytanoyl-CoA dioxygenase family)